MARAILATGQPDSTGNQISPAHLNQMILSRELSAVKCGEQAPNYTLEGARGTWAD
jgi:hypothetical protein